MPSIETREVLAAAYQFLPPGSRTLLSHAVFIDAEGNALEVLCDRVLLDSLADPYASNRHAKPTCPACLRRLKQLGVIHGTL